MKQTEQLLTVLKDLKLFIFQHDQFKVFKTFPFISKPGAVPNVCNEFPGCPGLIKQDPM